MIEGKFTDRTVHHRLTPACHYNVAKVTIQAVITALLLVNGKRIVQLLTPREAFA
jgi:hypothetical protein